MAVRRVIKIDQDKCVGCGLCASACHEGAIGIIDGKATLLRDDYCDGLGNCLPHCPTDAISFEEREAAAYNKEVAPKRVAAKKEAEKDDGDCGCGCSSSLAKAIVRTPAAEPLLGGGPGLAGPGPASAGAGLASPNPMDALQPARRAQQNQGSFSSGPMESRLGQWPVQIKLVPVNAPYFDGAKLLIAADCTAYAYANFHEDFIKGKITVIGCPKLDEGDYKDKLTDIIRENNIKSVTVVRMEVPCCGGMERAATEALKDSGKFIPWQIVTISTDGRILD